MSEPFTPVLVVFLVLGIVVAAAAVVAVATVRAQRRRSRSSDLVYDVVALATIDAYLRHSSVPGRESSPTDTRGALQMRRDHYVARALSGLTGSELAHNPSFQAAFRAGVTHASDLPPLIDPGQVDEVLDRAIDSAVLAELRRRSG
ncbi:MAG: hypothetical protein JWL64_16 [Frankiales bacterium]|nr:hypothetical protein [Frankiales bacterium]